MKGSTVQSPREGQHVASVCPECEGELTVDREHGETVCSDCGLVVEEESIDRGPEWRAFNPRETDEKSRVGAPTTTMIHDKGLSTNIGWQDKDAYGKSLSPRQRERMQRLRTWDERFRTRDSKERNLQQALGEIDRMASALGLPDTVRETASVIYRRALAEDLLPGRSIEGVATASLYASARQADLSRSLDEIATVSRVEKDKFANTYRVIEKSLALQVEPQDPAEYVPRFISSLGLSERTERRAKELVVAAGRAEVGVGTGSSPVVIAASAVYAAAKITGEDVTQKEVEEVTDVSERSIRNHYPELMDLM